MDSGTAIAIIIALAVVIIGSQLTFGKRRRRSDGGSGDGGSDGHDSDGGSDGGGDGGGGGD